MKYRAFTLVELLVVAAILAMMGAVISGATISAKQSANRRVCASNLRQLGLALHLYADANQDRLPPYANSELSLGTHRVEPIPGGTSPFVEWPRLLRESLTPYGAQGDVWFCPSDPVRGKQVTRLGIWHEHMSYSYSATARFANEGRTKDAAILLTDPNARFSGRLGRLAWCSPLFADPVPAEWHNGFPLLHHGFRVNAVFADLSTHSLKNGGRVRVEPGDDPDDPCWWVAKAL